MTERVRARLELLKSREYRKSRRGVNIEKRPFWQSADEYVRDFNYVTELARPIIHADDVFGFCIGISEIIPSPSGNVSVNYSRFAKEGFEKTRERILRSMEKTADAEKLEYGRAMLSCLDVCEKIAKEHANLAKNLGKTKLSDAIMKLLYGGADTFYEALVAIRMWVYFLRVGFASHLGFGRFDQYMYPYYLADKARGVTDSEIFEILEEFFISISFDSDIYQGIQQGDNGQSMVLGGSDINGKSQYNELSEMCLRASLELDLIDPKINLRVSRDTPDSLYLLGTELTRRGLGFPQYSNDDVVIPGLIKLGYAPEDAVNYVVAACWEFIIPNCGADIPNIGTFDFPGVINRVVMRELANSESFDALISSVKLEIARECDAIIASKGANKMRPCPLMSILIDGCTEGLFDMWVGAKYRNYGCHGAGISNAADALAAIKKNVFEEKSISAAALLDALKNNFEGESDIRNILISSPKMGDNDDYVDTLATEIMQAFSDGMNGRDNGIGGVWRAGTGSAMEYIWRGDKCPATADGRRAGEPYSSSFSPSLDVKNNGLLSVIQSFTKFDMENIINGGPLTLEIHDSVLRSDVGISKVAMLVKTFVTLGGHQLQLNSVNRERLLDAQANPEKYPGLIVRVWGWSGYFSELDVKYQNHIIRRAEHTL